MKQPETLAHKVIKPEINILGVIEFSINKLEKAEEARINGFFATVECKNLHFFTNYGI